MSKEYDTSKIEFVSTRMWGFYWRVSDCAELVVRLLKG